MGAALEHVIWLPVILTAGCVVWAGALVLAYTIESLVTRGFKAALSTLRRR